jgi:hypothetical protein
MYTINNLLNNLPQSKRGTRRGGEKAKVKLNALQLTYCIPATTVSARRCYLWLIISNSEDERRLNFPSGEFFFDNFDCWEKRFKGKDDCYNEFVVPPFKFLSLSDIASKNNCAFFFFFHFWIKSNHRLEVKVILQRMKMLK